MAEYLVTGGGGFIGSHIVEALLAAGQQVRVLDNFSTGRRENLADCLADIRLYEADIRDLPRVREAVAGVDYVLHQAALPSVPRSVADPLTSFQVNEEGTLKLLLAARDAGVKRVVFASSSSVYGDSPTSPKTEDMGYNPLSPYAVNKVTGELYCRNFYQLYGLETVSLRYFNVFGPRQDPTSQYAAVIPKFVCAMLSRRPPTIFGDGDQSRDFTYIENVVWANIRAATAPGVAGEVLNIATGCRITVNELFYKLRDILHSDLEPIYASPREGDIRHSLAGIAKAEELLGFKPLVSFEQGLEATVEWFSRNGRPTLYGLG
jgi:nucleoside-diphosphate-sugar epimerase